ncbi:hypothetical protein I3F60_17605 [Streptomyces sp. MUM 136J]|uniref:hypothetical protein n=1 Tax=Streptomyces sp. MUM 136J TaxID=2791992 RepID=UPI001F04500B|nr:hypothetical protein [Streptomyces sp. MUM 136J]MCH0571051.1 hypothetical protein [Streptomyces sp. MUM 136J]
MGTTLTPDSWEGAALLLAAAAGLGFAATAAHDARALRRARRAPRQRPPRPAHAARPAARHRGPVVR